MGLLTRKLLLLSLCFCCVITQSFAQEIDYNQMILDHSKQIELLTKKVELLEEKLRFLQKNNETANIKDASDSNGASDDISSDRSFGGASLNHSSPENNSAEISNQVKNSSLLNLSITEDRAVYDIALVSFKDKDFKGAEQQFHEFINNFPNSPLLSNAYFWQGESLYQRGLFEKAIVIYLDGYKLFPKGAKAAESLLKSAYALNSLKKRKDACILLEKIDAEFSGQDFNFQKRVSDARMKFMCNTRSQINCNEARWSEAYNNRRATSNDVTVKNGIWYNKFAN